MKIIAATLACLAILLMSGIVAAQKAPIPSGNRGAVPDATGGASKPEVSRKKAKAPKKRKSKRSLVY
jgi:hypothetical protein